MISETIWYITACVRGATSTKRVSESDALLFARTHGLVRAERWFDFPGYSLYTEPFTLAEPMLTIEVLYITKEQIEEFLSNL